MKTIQTYITELEQAVSGQQDMLEALNKLLANTFVTYLIAHNFHWNVRGDQFIELHKQFGDIYNEHWSAVDDIAERIRAVGHLVDGTGVHLLVNSDVKEASVDLTANEMVSHLLSCEEACSRSCNDLISKATDSGDQASMDLGVKRVAIHDKFAWMLRSILGVGK